MTTRRWWTTGLILALIVLGLAWFGSQSQSPPPRVRLDFLGFNPDINSPLSLASRPQRALFRITNSGPAAVRIDRASFARDSIYDSSLSYRLSLDQRVLDPGQSMELESPGVRANTACQLNVNFSPEGFSGRLSRKYHHSTNFLARVVGRRLFPFCALSANSDWITNWPASQGKDMQVINR